MVNVSANTEKTEEEEKEKTVARSSFKQSFERQFSVPSNANDDKVDFRFDGDYLVIQFPKISKSLSVPYDV
jgi:HSP20 family molecular chaperone IbpA